MDNFSLVIVIPLIGLTLFSIYKWQKAVNDLQDKIDEGESKV